jgi:glycosyltransferase involved in cell wall biosynthesis
MATAAPEFGLETPLPLAPQANYLRLEGWGFLPGAKTTTVRLRLGKQIHAPEQADLTRKDVAKRFPEEPAATRCGFLFVVFLPVGMHEGVLEFSADAGKTWVKARDFSIPVSPHPLMGGFEPAGEDGLLTETTRLSGWCWHPELTIAEVVMLQGDIEVPVDWRQERPDVAERFPEQPEARFAGFITSENLPRGRGKLRLQVTTTCGRTYFLDPQLEARISEAAHADPRPPPEMWELNLPAAPPADSGEAIEGKIASGPTNLLLVLHGDFTANSAYHVTALANELIARGYDCVVAVPDHPETIGAQPDARFLALEFSELSSLPQLFRDGRGPAVTHLWSARERLRLLWEEIDARYDTELVVHLEDNDEAILAEHLGLDASALAALAADKLDKKVPLDQTHPVRARELLQAACGTTLIYESLAELLPEGVAHCTFWPAATSAFGPRERATTLRAGLGIPEDDTVLFYHGNTHDANVSEVGELYEAVARLNAAGHATWLVRTGRDTKAFVERYGDLLGLRLVHLGFIKRSQDLPELMAMADYFVQPGEPGDFNDYRFPSKLPEFFALGRPVILPASNLGRQLKHERDAYVLPAATAAEICAAVQRLQADAPLRARLAQGALDFATKHFSWPRSTGTLLGFYHEVTALGAPDKREIEAAGILNRSFETQ